MTEVSASLDGIGTSMYNRDAAWVENYVEEVLRLVREHVNPEFARWVKTGSPSEER